MWLYVPEARPQICKDDITLLSIHSGGGMLDEGIKAGLEHSTGRRTIGVGYCERQAGAAATLVARMEDAGLDSAPIWDDSGTLPCKLWRDRVAVVTAGIPCQPWSGAGARLGVLDPRWLWPHIARILREVRPSLLILENVAGFLTPHDLDRDGFAGWSLPAGLGVILGELAEMGWDAEWVCLPAAAVGAHHLRWRVFVGAVPSDRKHAVRARLGGAHPKARTRRRAAHSAGTARPDTKGIGKRATRKQASTVRRTRTWQGTGGDGDSRPNAESAERRSPDDRRRSESERRDAEGEEASRPCQRDAAGPHAEGGNGRLLLCPRDREKSGPQSRRVGEAGTDTQRNGWREGTEAIRTRESESPRCGGGPGAEDVPPDTTGLPLFALPPQECGAWQLGELVEPAIESGLRVNVHGMAVVVDEARVTQLRTSGNGVVALQSAVATVALVERLGITQGNS